MSELSVVIPALNEADNLEGLLPRLKAVAPDAEIIVVSDGSSDHTRAVCERAGVRCIAHPYRLGNGAAVKTGLRAVNGRRTVLMDADGQHQPEDIPRLLEALDSGFNVAVGARASSANANWLRRIGNALYNRLASWIVGRPILDLTSGFRAVDTALARECLPLFPNGFSYPATITMAFFRSGYTVQYVGVDMPSRGGKSHLSPWRDGVRFGLIIFRIGTLYSPLKLFVPISALFAALGASNYLYTFITSGRFTNMSGLMLVSAVLIFLIGLVSEQIVLLLYKRDD